MLIVLVFLSFYSLFLLDLINIGRAETKQTIYCFGEIQFCVNVDRMHTSIHEPISTHGSNLFTYLIICSNNNTFSFRM